MTDVLISKMNNFKYNFNVLIYMKLKIRLYIIKHKENTKKYYILFIIIISYYKTSQYFLIIIIFVICLINSHYSDTDITSPKCTWIFVIFYYLKMLN